MPIVAEARRFAVEALWHGAAAVVLERNANTADFSPDWAVARDGGSPDWSSSLVQRRWVPQDLAF